MNWLIFLVFDQLLRLQEFFLTQLPTLLGSNPFFFFFLSRDVHRVLTEFVTNAFENYASF